MPTTRQNTKNYFKLSTSRFHCAKLSINISPCSGQLNADSFLDFLSLTKLFGKLDIQGFS